MYIFVFPEKNDSLVFENNWTKYLLHGLDIIWSQYAYMFLLLSLKDKTQPIFKSIEFYKLVLKLGQSNSVKISWDLEYHYKQLYLVSVCVHLMCVIGEKVDDCRL